MASVAVQSVVATVKNNLSALAVVSPTSIGGGSTRIKEECHTSIGSGTSDSRPSNRSYRNNRSYYCLASR